jgi:hypothetical protein
VASFQPIILLCTVFIRSALGPLYRDSVRYGADRNHTTRLEQYSGTPKWYWIPSIGWNLFIDTRSGQSMHASSDSYLTYLSTERKYIHEITILLVYVCVYRICAPPHPQPNFWTSCPNFVKSCIIILASNVAPRRTLIFNFLQLVIADHRDCVD